MSEPSRSTGRRRKAGSGKKVAARRDFEALAERRMRAAEMFARGKRQVDVVVELGVSAQTASRWHRAWTAGGRQALAGAGRAGRLPTLTEQQLAEVAGVLTKGPKANGFPTDMWTLARVAQIIEKVTGVRYSQTQTWTILRERLGWSRQRPARRATERDQEAIEQWVANEWPRIKKAPGAEGPGSAFRTSPDSPCCLS
jgi:transposase